VQVPPGQDSLALGRLQVAPHEPQLESVVSEASQPSDDVPLQLP
jgi:hypothetical protein